MSVRRVMGIETEYGVSLAGHPEANPVVLSGQVVTGYARSRGIRAHRANWDYSDEHPLRDARGFDVARAAAHPSQLTDEPDTNDPEFANVVLSNGARLYVDHAHPEYSSPEVTNPLDAVRWDRAGEVVMRDAVSLLAASPPPINLYKNNTDGKSSSYGTHENYLMRRATPFRDIVAHLTPFFVVRQVMCGAGRVGLGVDSRNPGFQISSRADFFEAEVGLETTLKRPIINTRDEPHASADKYRRLHVIIGDANHADVANLVKLGSTSLVLAMIEDEFFTEDLWVRDPVATLHRISHDPSLTEHVVMRGGRTMTALDLLRHYRDLAGAYLQRQHGQSSPDHDTAQVMSWWTTVTDALATDPMSARAEVDWVAKLAVLQAYQERHALDWSDSRLAAIDIQWSDVRLNKGLANALRAQGQLRQLVTEEEAIAAAIEPPNDTRAYFRGRVLSQFPEQVAAASWDSVIVDPGGGGPLKRVPMNEPTRGTRDEVASIFDQAATVSDLLDSLTSPQ